MKNKCKCCNKLLTAIQIIRKYTYCSHFCASKCKYNSVGYDDTFLNKETELRAYFLGFLITDGDIGKNFIRIGCKDYQLMNDIAKRVSYRNKICKEIGSGYSPTSVMYRMRFYGRIFKKACELGFKPGTKTGNEFIPKCITKKYFKHFMRGVIDGDGSFYMNKLHDNKYLRCSIVCSNYEFLEELAHKLHNYIEVNLTKILPSKNIFQIKYNQKDSIKIGKYIYKKSTIKLDRKHHIFKVANQLVLSKNKQKKK